MCLKLTIEKIDGAAAKLSNCARNCTNGLSYFFVIVVLLSKVYDRCSISNNGGSVGPRSVVEHTNITVLKLNRQLHLKIALGKRSCDIIGFTMHTKR